jgi:dethiobiotin synthetase
VIARPGFLVLVAGTGTEVGKTWVTAAVIRELGGRGARIAARKPAQSFAVGEGPTDAEVLAAATGEAAATVCPPSCWYEVPMAPPMAAAALGRPVPTIAGLVAGIPFAEPVDIGFVESAGGVASPLADDGDTADLGRALGPDLVLLVADAGLGTIHAVRTSALRLEGWPLLVQLNRYDAADELHARNRAWLADRDGLTVATDVGQVAAHVEHGWRAKVRA